MDEASAAGSKQRRRRVGIIGFGQLGQYLYEEVCKQPGYEVVFIWNRSIEKMKDLVSEHLILRDLNDCSSRHPDLIVEVAHPSISAEYGMEFLKFADFMIGSPTALADATVYKSLLGAAQSEHGLYVPAGAFWGGQDIQKMANQGTLKGLTVTMKKHPSAFKLVGPLEEKLKTVLDKPLTLFKGPVRELCPLAPNNVNTMACAAIAAHNLGFDGVIGCLIADPNLESHVVEIEVVGPGQKGNNFSVKTVRNNPASAGAVTGKQTYGSFSSSLFGAVGKGKGVHLC
ncbi:aspartate dehydrogenase domain-containing protein-like [Halichondria panicea]|uniref:aspartate dehydrogenase domain-containing protein-like n=1 Tax=Halichondria panicea TaxID=6063 RepID=UPI00312BA1E3